MEQMSLNAIFVSDVPQENLCENLLCLAHAKWIGFLPNVQAKAARATDESANQVNARGARSLFCRRLGIVSSALTAKGTDPFSPQANQVDSL